MTRLPLEKYGNQDATMPSIGHQAFAEAIAIPDSTSEDRLIAASGFLVLRLMDDWTARDSIQPARFDATAEYIEKLAAGATVRESLMNLLSTMRRRPRRVDDLLSGLFGYGRALELEALWRLAIDVYANVIKLCGPNHTSERVLAYLRLGYCYRSSNAFGGAVRMYKRARKLAIACRDREGYLRSWIGMSQLAIARGNLPVAQRTLERVLDAAERVGSSFIAAKALHELAAVLLLRREHETAIPLLHRALQMTTDSRDHERILGDIAAAFLDIGIVDVARDAYTALASIASERSTRWQAKINLIELESQMGNANAVEAWIQRLAENPPSTRWLAEFHLAAGQAYQRLKRDSHAIPHLRAAFAIATEHGFNQMLFDADMALRGFPPPPSECTKSLVGAIGEIGGAIRLMREALSGQAER